METNYTLRDFLPLIIIFSIVFGLTAASQYIRGFSWQSTMADFMGFFFIIFGSFKIMNLHGFVKAYKMYDIIAQRSTAYTYAYPFIEISLGIAYLARLFPFATNIITLLIMTISSIGVAVELAQQKQFTCACLGALFNIPMTYITLAEDFLMALMALANILF
jgi:hypothetical protein